MNENERHLQGSQRAGEGELPDALRWQLRALRRDQPPARDLWAGIAARLGEQAPAGADAPAPADVQPAPVGPVAVEPTRSESSGSESAAAPVKAAPATAEPAAPFALTRRAAPRRRWLAPLALAASVAALAVGIGSQFQAQGPAAPSADAVADRAAPMQTPGRAASNAAPTLVQREAQGMTLQYQAALREVDPQSSARVAMKPAFDDLDRNAALILDALSHDPDSRMLLEQLRRTYARRLALAQRLAYT